MMVAILSMQKSQSAAVVVVAAQEAQERQCLQDVDICQQRTGPFHVTGPTEFLPTQLQFLQTCSSILFQARKHSFYF